MCAGKAKATTASSPTGAQMTYGGAASNYEQAQADAYARYARPEVVNLDPMEALQNTAKYNQITTLMNKQGKGDENYNLRNATRNQITQDVENVDPALRGEFLKSGVMDAALSGESPNSTSNGAIVANVMGRHLIDYRRASQDQAMKFMNSNPSQNLLPTGSDLTGMQYMNRQNYADARNQMAQNIAAMNERSLQGWNNRTQQALASAQEWGANTATGRNNMSGANSANKGQMMGAGIGAVGAIAGVAILA